MGLFSKKEKVPSLPPASKVSEPPKEKEEIVSLPTLPGRGNDDLNQQMTKSAVTDSSEDDSHEENEVDLPKDFDFKKHSQIPSLNSIQESQIKEVPRKEKENDLDQELQKLHERIVQLARD
jgi:hypothetical protein